MAIIPGTCHTCGHYGYLFESKLCMMCEDKRLRDKARTTESDEDWEMLAMFREYVQDTAR